MLTKGVIISLTHPLTRSLTHSFTDSHSRFPIITIRSVSNDDVIIFPSKCTTEPARGGGLCVRECVREGKIMPARGGGYVLEGV